jgi:AcrR family transcriptional regulator
MVPPATTQRKVPRAVREEQMLEVARREFASRGFHAVSMDEIARAVGISKPMLYAYFDSKEGLFLACVGRAADALYAAVRAAAEESSTDELRLWRGYNAVLRFVEENDESWRILYPYGPTAAGPFAAAAARARDTMSELLTELMTETAVARGVDPEVAKESAWIGHVVTGATIAIGSWWRDHPEEPRELMALRLMNFTWMGLQNMVRGELWVPPEGGDR